MSSSSTVPFGVVTAAVAVPIIPIDVVAVAVAGVGVVTPPEVKRQLKLNVIVNVGWSVKRQRVQELKETLRRRLVSLQRHHRVLQLTLPDQAPWE